jgi:hypothetical protein
VTYAAEKFLDLGACRLDCLDDATVQAGRRLPWRCTLRGFFDDLSMHSLECRNPDTTFGFFCPNMSRN